MRYGAVYKGIMKKKNFKELIDPYIDDNPQWDKGTKELVRKTLTKNCHLVDLEPASIFRELSARYGERTALTVSTHLRSYIDYLITEGLLKGPNELRIWSRKHLRKKHVTFKPEIPRMSFEEAQKLILTLKNQKYRLKALQLLHGGLRFSESLTYDPVTQSVKGKGRRVRCVPLPEELRDVPFLKSDYRNFVRRLHEIGLKPHDLRKIRASQLALELDTVTLKNLFGWSSMMTAEHYVAGAHIEDTKQKLVLPVPKEAFRDVANERPRKCS